MFSVNYMMTYIAEGMISSGMVAVTFTLLLYYNIFATRILFKTPIRRNVVVGAVIGGIGIGLIFLQEILHFQPGSKSLWGLIVGAVATMFASAGNLVSYVHRKENIPVMSSNAFGMLYGSCFTFLVALVLREGFHVDWTLKYTLSLLYLAIFGSVIAFGAYLSLVGRIGAEKAAYTSIISPVIALTLSSLYEGFHWTPKVATGIALCLAGNVITLQRPKKRATI